MPIAAHHGLNNGYHDDAPDLIRSEVVIISSDAPKTFTTFLPYARQMLATLRFPA